MKKSTWKQAGSSILIGLFVGLSADAKTPRKASPAKETRNASKTPSRKNNSRLVGTKWFLTHKEFVALTKPEQKKYLRGVKKVLGSLPEKSRYFALSASSPRNPANNDQLSPQQISELIEAAMTNLRTPLESDKPGTYQHAQDALYVLTYAWAQYNSLPDKTPGKAEVGVKLKNSAAIFYRTPVMPELKPAFDLLQKTRHQKLTQNQIEIPRNALAIRSEGQRKILPPRSPVGGAASAGTASAATQAPPAIDPKIGAQIIAAYVVSRPRVATENEPGPATDAPGGVQDISGPAPDSVNLPLPDAGPPSGSAPSTGPRFYRCMYAGFVLKHDPCKGPQSPPHGMEFLGLDNSAMSCEADQVLCNPLLFGVRSSCTITDQTTDEELATCLQSAAPLCVSRNKFATRNCGETSNSENLLGTAAALIRKNEALWNDYLTSFYELCDDGMISLNGFAEVSNGEPREIPESTRSDIAQTCDNAKVQLAQLTEQFRVSTQRPAGPAAAPATPAAPAESTEVQP